MAAGKYRDNAVFQRKTGAALDAYGNPTNGGWGGFFEGPAWLRETPGKEALAAGRLEAPATGTLRMLASPTSPLRDITSADRVRVRGHLWNIRGGPVDPDGLGRQVEFILERGVATS